MSDDDFSPGAGLTPPAHEASTSDAHPASDHTPAHVAAPGDIIINQSATAAGVPPVLGSVDSVPSPPCAVVDQKQRSGGTTRAGLDLSTCRLICFSVFVIDVETGGLDPRESPLLEIGIEHLATGERKSWMIRCPLARWLNWWPWLAKRFGAYCDPEAMEINDCWPEAGRKMGVVLGELVDWMKNIEHRTSNVEHRMPGASTEAEADDATQPKTAQGSEERDTGPRIGGTPTAGQSVFLLAGMNPHFDLSFLRVAFAKVTNDYFPFSHRTIDLHTLAVREAIKRGDECITNLKTDEIYRRAGEEPEQRPHRAGEGARREAALFHRLLNDAT